MRPGGSAFVAAVIAGLALATGAVAGPREVVDECVRAAPDDETTGLDDLEEACPGLSAALEALGVGAFLPDATRDNLTRHGIERAIALASPRPSRAIAPLPRASLDRALSSLKTERPPDSWWERFKAWLRRLFLGGNTEPGSDWLARWLSRWSVSEVVAKTVFYTLAALLIAIAIGIVVNELRASGVFGPAERGARRRLPGSAERAESLTLDAVAAAPLERRAALLFELLVQRLGDRGRLRRGRELTHRELRAAAPFRDAADGERFAHLAATAEAQLFAPTPPPGERVERALVDGEALLRALASPGEAGA